MRFGSWLAISALAIQLVLSFGHVHAEDLAPAASIGTSFDADRDGGNPSEDHNGFVHHNCDICATIALLATLVIPSPPALVVLKAYSITPNVILDNGRRFGASVRPFEARAPPLA
ncbi:MAG TPA: DUF2946 family protein [Pseudolabrys sp.]|nr:DUF2946 family protein [Pseudolabrys sp.]